MKCVLMTDEDMSEPKNNVSDVVLRISITEPDATGNCVLGGQAVSARTDNGYDLKHQVSYEQLEPVNLEGKCAEVELINYGTTSSGLTTHAFCYSAGIADYAWTAEP